MSEHDNLIREALQALVPTGSDVQPDWEGVLRRAEVGDLQPLPARPPTSLHVAERRTAKRARPRRKPHRSLVVAIALLLALTVAVFAIAASQGWWFFQTNSVPTPAGSVAIVDQGEWDGHPWQLVAYQAASGETCYSLTPTQVGSTAATFSCTDVGSGTPGIGVLSLGQQPSFPPYIVGPVDRDATLVRLSTDDGRTIDTPAIEAPASSGLDVRFYATDLPCGTNVTRVEGLNAAGERTAELELPRGQEVARDNCPTSPQ